MFAFVVKWNFVTVGILSLKYKKSPEKASFKKVHPKSSSTSFAIAIVFQSTEDVCY
jgi:hypothetical protein